MRAFICFFVMFFCISGIRAQESAEYDIYKDPWDMRSDSVNMDSLSYYCNIVDIHNKRLESVLPTMSKDDIAKLIDRGDYLIDGQTFEKISFFAMPALMRWSAGIPDDKSYDDDEQALECLYSVGLEAIYVGEGYAELENSISFYLDMLRPYADEQSVEYLAICDLFSSVISMDAGLVIPLKSLMERCIRAEKYLVEYPQSIHCSSILPYYYSYMQELMFCTEPNTLTFDRNTNLIGDEVYENLLSLTALYPDTHTGQILQAYIEGLKKNDLKYTKEL